MTRYAIVNGSNMVAGAADFVVTPTVPAPFTVVPVTVATGPAQRGYTWNGTTFVPHDSPEVALAKLLDNNHTTILNNARTALTNNANYLAIPSPSNVQAVAQVTALTRQIDGVIRVLLNAFDAIT